jgi:integrase
MRWCQRGRIPPWRPDEVNLANYLASEFARGVGSGSAASARSAITSTWRLGVGRVPEEGGIVTALMRGFKRKRPTEARYEEAFDVRHLLDWIEQEWSDNEALSSVDLRTKTIVLLRITSLKRARDIAKMVKASIQEDDTGRCTFRMLDEKRPDGAGELSQRYPIFKNAERPAICPWAALQLYLERTAGWADGPRDAIFRWLERDQPLGKDAIANASREVMQRAGIPEEFRSHSLRMAGATRMLDAGIPLQQVMRIGGWTSGEVFQRFYDRSRIPRNVAQRMAAQLGHDEESV